MPTALVTGASHGIGEGFVRALARRGYDLVLVARTGDAMEKIAIDVRALGRTAEVIPADLTDAAGLARVEARLADHERPVDLLVNNAGFGSTGRFHELAIDGEEREIRLNVLALVRLAHAALGGMVARGAGGVINIGSIAGFQAAPGNATYAATKAFVLNFSLALTEEVRGAGVKVLCVAPGFVKTGFQEQASYEHDRIPKLAWLTVDDVVDGSLRAFDAGRALYTTGWVYKALAGATHLAPRTLLPRIARLVTRQI